MLRRINSPTVHHNVWFDIVRGEQEEGIIINIGINFIITFHRRRHQYHHHADRDILSTLPVFEGSVLRGTGGQRMQALAFDGNTREDISRKGCCVRHEARRTECAFLRVRDIILCQLSCFSLHHFVLC